MDVRVDIIRETSEELVNAFGRLLLQLSSTAKPLDHETVRQMVTCDANTADLTSRPDRSAANRLYERLGFRTRQSTVYRFALDE
ncbi:hypothetical protein [Streptomyces monashensis]|uniref:N-acetyltransferase domain-containing protein n=1 Tax=Streptomyces monashensis TaxID=1678012 RepID=A0A1S2QKE0_9ACTN|nr:hypothetical protein [Streptomyces monashensis]OIK06554.1 hypothetical protein BIV23_07705 [Streptomyces monashensis]